MQNRCTKHVDVYHLMKIVNLIVSGEKYLTKWLALFIFHKLEDSYYYMAHVVCQHFLVQITSLFCFDRIPRYCHTFGNENYLCEVVHDEKSYGPLFNALNRNTQKVPFLKLQCLELDNIRMSIIYTTYTKFVHILSSYIYFKAQNCHHIFTKLYIQENFKSSVFKLILQRQEHHFEIIQEG